MAGRYLNEASRELLLGSEDGAAPVVVWLPSEGDLAQTEIEAGSDDDHVTVVLSLRSGVVVRIPAARVDGTWQFDLRP